MKLHDWLLAVLIVLVLQTIKEVVGWGSAATVAVAIMSFCLGALWADRRKPDPTASTPSPE